MNSHAKTYDRLCNSIEKFLPQKHGGARDAWPAAWVFNFLVIPYGRADASSFNPFTSCLLADSSNFYPF